MKITEVFNILKKQGKTAFIPFIMAGDPSMEVTIESAIALERAGAHILEIGMPFSDPVADGPVIQAASERALANGINMDKILDGIIKLRQVLKIPIILMGYYNPILSIWVENFIKKAVNAGINGMIVADLSPEEGEEWSNKLKNAGIDPVFLITSFSGHKRWALIESFSAGMVYYVSYAGVTGGAVMPGEELLKALDEVRAAIKLPVVVGFGVREKKAVEILSPHCDGVVVGSAIINAINNGEDIEKYVKQLIDVN